MYHFTLVGPSYQRNGAGNFADLQNLLGTTLVLRVIFKSRRHLDSSSASNQRAKRALWHWVFIIASLAASRVLPVPIVDEFEGRAPVDDEDSNAAQDAGC